MLLNYVHHPVFEPGITELSGKILTHLNTAPSTLFRNSFHGIYTNGDGRWKGHQIRAWSSYTSWSTLFCFVLSIQQSFSWNLCIKDGNQWWTKLKVMPTSIADKSHVYTWIAILVWLFFLITFLFFFFCRVTVFFLYLFSNIRKTIYRT